MKGSSSSESLIACVRVKVCLSPACALDKVFTSLGRAKVKSDLLSRARTKCKAPAESDAPGERKRRRGGITKKKKKKKKKK